jgi:hypothetical protein
MLLSWRSSCLLLHCCWPLWARVVLLLQTVVHVLGELEERVGDVWAEHARVGLGAGRGARVGGWDRGGHLGRTL